jgi:hypothetical protein
MTLKYGQKAKEIIKAFTNSDNLLCTFGVIAQNNQYDLPKLPNNAIDDGSSGRYH